MDQKLLRRRSSNGGPPVLAHAVRARSARLREEYDLRVPRSRASSLWLDKKEFSEVSFVAWGFVM